MPQADEVPASTVCHLHLQAFTNLLPHFVRRQEHQRMPGVMRKPQLTQDPVPRANHYCFKLCWPAYYHPWVKLLPHSCTAL